MSENTVVLGIDHGYANMKTKNCVFASGLTAYAHEPYTKENVLEMGGKFYVVGSGRQALQKDKAATEDYYLLTLAAIAREIEYRKLGRNLSIHLAVISRNSRHICCGTESLCSLAMRTEAIRLLLWMFRFFLRDMRQFLCRGICWRSLRL